MKARSPRMAAAAVCLLLVPFFASSCGSEEAAYRVALVGFKQGGAGEERNAVAEYGVRRVEAELGVDVDFIVPHSPQDSAGVFTGEENGYDLVISLGQDTSLSVLGARSGAEDVATCALDIEVPQAVEGEQGATLVRYRVEEGSYLCGYLAGWLSSRNDHPLTNSMPLVAFIGARSDPLMVYYDNGFRKGVSAGIGKEGTHAYYLEAEDEPQQARAYAEEALKNGADIIFCTPGPFNQEVIEVAEEKDALVILVGSDRSSESPDHVLTSLLLRDDNTIFAAVKAGLEGDLKAGRQVWGAESGAWSLAPFHGHDPYIRRELKESLRKAQQEAPSIDFS